MAESRWRTGRKVGRTIYAMVGLAPSDDDPLIGVMDTPELAAEVVDAHNERLNRAGESDAEWDACICSAHRWHDQCDVACPCYPPRRAGNDRG